MSSCQQSIPDLWNLLVRHHCDPASYVVAYRWQSAHLCEVHTSPYPEVWMGSDNSISVQLPDQLKLVLRLLSCSQGTVLSSPSAPLTPSHYLPRRAAEQWSFLVWLKMSPCKSLALVLALTPGRGWEQTPFYQQFRFRSAYTDGGTTPSGPSNCQLTNRFT